MQSQGFSRFREFIGVLEGKAQHIRHFLELQGIVLFFKKGKEYFGAGEDGRVVFARLKNPDDETSKGWEDEANFTATNLNKMIQGEPSTHVFSKDDLKSIKVVDEEQVIDALSNIAAEAGPDFKPIRIIRMSKAGDKPVNRDDVPNFIRADEE